MGAHIGYQAPGNTEDYTWVVGKNKAWLTLRCHDGRRYVEKVAAISPGYGMALFLVVVMGVHAREHLEDR